MSPVSFDAARPESFQLAQRQAGMFTAPAPAGGTFLANIVSSGTPSTFGVPALGES